MKFGVAENQLIVHLPSGYSAYSGKLASKEERMNMAEELLGAVVLLVRDDLNTHEEVVDFALDNLR